MIGKNSDEEARADRSLSRGVAPELLKESASGESCCIFRVPQGLLRNNPSAYEPRVVSIGPYHHGEAHWKMVEEHKHRFLKLFVAEALTEGMDLQDLVDTVSQLEEDIRASYSESLVKFGREELIYMMVLDGCFILMLFFVVVKMLRYTQLDDPIFRMPWLLHTIRSDLLLLENQVPFILLETLFKESSFVTSSCLNQIAFRFFSYSMEKQDDFWGRHNDVEATHLLDLIRHTFISVPSPETRPGIIFCSPFLRFVLSARKLHPRVLNSSRRRMQKRYWT